jgi:hypothetical protein
MEAALTTLTSPVILFFLLGGLAAVARSDLAIPEAMAKGPVHLPDDRDRA